MLRDWQLALFRLVEGRAAGRDLSPESLDRLTLTLDEEERSWLRELSGTRGFAVTARVPRWWRGTRIRRGARLTFAALGVEGEAHLEAYRRAIPNFTMFHVSEALAFLDYVARMTRDPRVRAVAQFEKAVWEVRRADSLVEPVLEVPMASAAEPSSQSVLRPHPAAAMLELDAPLEEVLASLLEERALPACADRVHHVLVAPGIPRWWRAATASEWRVFHASSPNATVEELCALPGSSLALVTGLREARALR